MKISRSSPWMCFLASVLVCLLTAKRGQAFVTTTARSITTIHTTPTATSFQQQKAIVSLPQQQSFQQTTASPFSSSSLYMATNNEGEKSGLPFWLDPGTRGGAVFLSLLLFILPLVAYSVVTSVFGVDEVEAGKWIGVGFTATASFLWVATYIFRVATKDMTYAKQLKDYENAVIAKRLEELDDDEIQALVEEIERDDF